MGAIATPAKSTGSFMNLLITFSSKFTISILIGDSKFHTFDVLYHKSSLVDYWGHSLCSIPKAPSEGTALAGHKAQDVSQQYLPLLGTSP